MLSLFLGTWSDFMFKMCISFIAAPIELMVDGVKGIKALMGHWAPRYPCRLYISQGATSSEWTQNHIIPLLCCEGVSVVKSAVILLSELSWNYSMRTQRQDLTLRSPTVEWDPVSHLWSAQMPPEHCDPVSIFFMVHRSSAMIFLPPYSMHEEMRWPTPKVSSASWLAWYFLGFSIEKSHVLGNLIISEEVGG